MRTPLLLLLFFISIQKSSHSQTITNIYVDSSATGLNDGTSWANAFTSFDSALNKCRRIYIDTIYIGRGTYKPSQLPPGLTGTTTDRDFSFYFPEFGYFLGGYPSGGGLRDPKKNLTVLSGDIGVPGDIDDNTFHVAIFLDNELDIDGLIFSNGCASGDDSLQIGSRFINRGNGGAMIVDGLINFTNVLISNNLAINGGGIATQGYGWTILRDCFLINNWGIYNGGAILIDTLGRLQATNCVFEGNQSNNGGAVYFYRSHGSIFHCTFANNSVYGIFGGAIFTHKVVQVNVRNCLFANNLNSDDNTIHNSDITDEEISPDVTGLSVSYSSLQSYIGNETCVYSGDGGLLDLSDPDGPDDLWGTNDDGLYPTASSPGFNKGRDGTINFDIGGTSRNTNGTFAIGAYEINPLSRITQRTIYVDSTFGSNAHSGNSWNDALTNLQAAINLVVAGVADTIKVAKGTYIPSTIPRGWRAPASNIIPSGYFTFHLPKNIVLLGGYSSGGALRDPDLYPTTLGAIGKVTQIITVVKSDSIIIDGFTFRYGRAEKNTMIIDGVEYPRTVGGGLFISQSTIKVKNCRFYNNIAQLKGGAIYSENSLVKMDSCVFEKSRAYQLNTGIGGAVYFYAMQAGTYITKCRFKYNTAWLLGGAMGVENSPNPILIDSCYFNNNSLEQPVSSARGGALYAGLGGSMIIQRSVFDSNGAYRGGAIYLNEPGTVTISQSFFDRNSAISDGGAIAFFSFNKILNIANCLFYNNIGPAGGAINASGTVRVFFSSFYKNHATANGGAISNSGSVTSTGNIFWDNDLNGNTTVAGSDVTSVNGGGYSLFQKLSLPGSNHTTGVYPEFRDTSNVKGPDNAWGTADDGLQLKVNSPIINESTNNLTNLFGPNPIDYITDIKGSLRVEGRYPDLGPYETNFCELTNFTNRTAFVDSSATGGNQSGTSWQNAFTTIEEALKVARSHCVDTIKVAKGTYEATAAPGYNKYNTPPTGKSLVVPDSIYVMGGYSSGGAEYSIATNPTIVKGKNFDRAFWFNSVKNSTIDGFILDSAGLRADGSQLELRNSVIKQGNTEPTAPLFFGDSRARVINCAFANNHGNFISGTVWQENSFIDYINSVFANNSYADFGGASCIAIRGNGAANITNCTFYRNSVISGGTITRFDDAAQLNIKNSLFWNNRYQTFAPDPDINDIWIRTNNPVLFTTSNNLFMNGTAPSPADSSIYGINPGFADTTNLVGPDGQWLTPDDGLSLSDTSSAINEGSNSFVPSGITTDIAGLTRIANGIVDIGAYEFECTGARGYTNKLVQLGTQETSVNRLLGCGSLRYMESQTTPETYITFIADNGNTINPSSVTVDATTNLVNFRTNGTDTTMLANRMLSIVAPGSYTTNGGVRVRIYYDPAEFSDLPHGLRSWFKHPAHTKAEVLNDLKFNGLTNATLLSPSSNGVENGIAYVEFSNVTSFSTFGFLGMTTIGPLPVNFLSFTAKEESLTGSAILDWTTGWEKNNDRFEIERSSDGIQWKKIGSVNAKGTASQGAIYSFVDVSPDLPQSLYRIKQVDTDEKFKYSPVREVIFHSNNREFVISPNPAATIVNIRFPRIQSAINFEIIDISGRVKAKGIRINMQQFSLPVLELENGIYLLKINNSARKLIINR